MGKLFAILMVACLLTSLGFTSAALAGAYDDLSEGGNSTAYFDGGSGSTINTSYDTSNDVPDIGPCGPVE